MATIPNTVSTGSFTLDDGTSVEVPLSGVTLRHHYPQPFLGVDTSGHGAPARPTVGQIWPRALT